MDPTARDFFDRLINTPGVSGFEQPVQACVADFIRPFCDGVDSDLHGNLMAVKNPGKPLRIMFAGHCDQIGLIVSQIDENGFIFTQTVGGWDPVQLVGQQVDIWTANGSIPGVVSRKALHLQDENERKQLPKAQELWIDTGFPDAESVKSKVAIGDSVTLRLGGRSLHGDIVAGPAMDDRSGLWVVMEAMRKLKEGRLKASLYSVSTVQEEIGLRGAKTAAYGIDPQVAIAVDVTHATDCPGIDRRTPGEIFLGRGPVIFRGPNINERIAQRLISLAKEHNLPFQIAALGRAASNDSNSLQISRAGVATGLVSIPNRYMHSAVEVVSLADMDAAANLLARFAESVSSADEFKPLN